MDFADEIKRRREAAGLTQTELSKLTGVPQPRIAEYETETRQPTLAALHKLGLTLGPFTVGDKMKDIIEKIAAELTNNYDDADTVGEFRRVDAGETPWLDYGHDEAWTDGERVIVMTLDEGRDRWIGEDDTEEFALKVATAHLESWDSSHPQTITDGFIDFVWAAGRVEMLAALTDRDDEQLVDDLVYSAHSTDRGARYSKEVMTKAFARLLEESRKDLVEALRESLEESPE